MGTRSESWSWDLLTEAEWATVKALIPAFVSPVCVQRVDGPGTWVLIYETEGDVRVASLRKNLAGERELAWDMEV